MEQIVLYKYVGGGLIVQQMKAYGVLLSNVYIACLAFSTYVP